MKWSDKIGGEFTGEEHMELSELKKLETLYKNGEITKQAYIEKMHDLHKILFEYSDYVVGKDVKEIRITDKSVIMTTRDAGITLECDRYDHRIVPMEILNFGDYEKPEIKMVLQLIDNSFCVLDVGANIGWYSLNISKKFESAKIFCFEPISKTFEYLQSNIRLNGCNNVTPINIGFSDVARDLTFYFYKEGSGNASLAHLADKDSLEKLTCKVDKLDNFVTDRGLSVDFIKCDVEGAELFVLRGGMETIQKDKPIIFLEMLRKWAAKFNYHPNEIIGLMKSAGYGCFVIHGDKLRRFVTMDENTVETNYIFLHAEKHSGVIKRLLLNE